LCTGCGTGIALAAVALSFGTSTDSFELSVDAETVLGMLTFRVETRISRLCDRRTREGMDRTLYSGVGAGVSASSPYLVFLLATAAEEIVSGLHSLQEHSSLATGTSLQKLLLPLLLGSQGVGEE
jgi:hypothetical protein